MNINAIAGSPNAPFKRLCTRWITGAGALVLAVTAVGAVAGEPVMTASPGVSGTIAPTAAKPALKPIDVFDLQWASDPQIAPDGRSIAYVRMSMDIKTDRPHRFI